MSTLPAKLRDLYEYANTHRTFDLGLLLEAASEIEYLEERISDKDEYIAELEDCRDMALRDVPNARAADAILELAAIDMQLRGRS